MSLDPAHVGSWRDPDLARIAPSHGTRPVLIGKAGPTGSRFHALSAINRGTANTLTLFLGKRLTAAGDMGSGALTTSSITRTAGSFLTDGWQPDDLLILNGSTTRANDAAAVVTAVAAQTLTFAASTFAAAEALPTGAMLCRASQASVSTIAANAGAAAGVAALDLLTSDKPFVDASPDRQIILGPLGAVFAAVGTAMAAGVWADLTLLGGDY